MVRTRALVSLALLLAVAGCSGPVHKGGHDVITNHYYFMDGFRIDSPYGVWTHKKGTPRDMVAIGMGYEKKELIDNDGDGRVDCIDINERRILPSDLGAEKLFAEAEAEFAHYRQWMHVEETLAKWSAMSATDIAKSAGYGKY